MNKLETESFVCVCVSDKHGMNVWDRNEAHKCRIVFKKQNKQTTESGSRYFTFNHISYYTKALRWLHMMDISPSLTTS